MSFDVKDARKEAHLSRNDYGTLSGILIAACNEFEKVEEERDQFDQWNRESRALLRAAEAKLAEMTKECTEAAKSILRMFEQVGQYRDLAARYREDLQDIAAYPDIAGNIAREALAGGETSVPIAEDPSVPPDQARLMQDGKLVGAVTNLAGGCGSEIGMQMAKEAGGESEDSDV